MTLHLAQSHTFMKKKSIWLLSDHTAHPFAMTSKQDETTDQTPSPLYLSAIRTDYQTVDTEEFQFLTRFEMVVGDPWNFHAQNVLSKDRTRLQPPTCVDKTHQ